MTAEAIPEPTEGRQDRWPTGLAQAEMAPGDHPLRDGFSNFCFGSTDIFSLRRLAGEPSPAVAEVFRVIGHLRQRPPGSFANIAELYAASGEDAGPDGRAIRLLRDLFIDGVDYRLQKDVYRKYFLDNPPQQGRHDQRILSLEASRAAAQEIVDSYDWRWLSDWLQLERIGENANSCLRRLSNFAFPVHRVNFRFTYHCNIQCRHCYNSSGPDLKAQRLPLAPMLDIVAQMPGAGIGYLNLTGGEPFLYPEHLTALIAAGRAAGLRGISIYSNAFWAQDAARARRALGRLADVGFMQGPGDHLKVSTGIYHQEFIAFDRILTLAPVFHAMFAKPLRVDFELAADGTDVTDEISRRIGDAGLADKIELSFRTVTPLGRGRELNGIASHSIDVPCNVINQIVFDPDGSARPCCGQNNENQGVVVGRLSTHSLRDLVKRMQNDPVLQFLARNPMNAIFEHVGKSKAVGGYAGTCHLCQDALGGLSDKEALQARLFEQQKFHPFWFSLPGEAEAAFEADTPPDGVD